MLERVRRLDGDDVGPQRAPERGLSDGGSSPLTSAPGSRPASLYISRRRALVVSWPSLKNGSRTARSKAGSDAGETSRRIRTPGAASCWKRWVAGPG